MYDYMKALQRQFETKPRSIQELSAEVDRTHKENGLPIYRYVYGKTQKELLDKLHQKMDTYRNVELTEDSRMTLSEWLDTWLADYKQGALRLSTLTCYRQFIEAYITPELGHIPLNKNDLQQFYGRLKKNGRKARTELYGNGLSDRMVRMCRATCRTALEKAVEDGLIRVNPAIGRNAGRGRGALRRSVITCGRDDTRLCGLTVKNTAEISMARPVKKSKPNCQI